ncbi:MAG TPA: aminopeptidase [Gaiellaceae bacterium]|nr:aminopeptidase [Gaiellaceae bacterium]
MDSDLLRRYARLIVDVGANVQPGQIVWIVAEPSAAELVRAVAAAAYDRGALFVDPWYFDPYVKRVRLERADPSSLEYVPPWFGAGLRGIHREHGVRISITPNTPPGIFAGIDPTLAGRDAMPAPKENFEVINAKTTQWCVVPWATAAWARVVHPGLDDDAAVAKLWEQLLYVLRLDEPDPGAAWIKRFAEIHEAGKRVDAHNFETLHFEGPGTDLQVGLLPTSHFEEDTPGMTSIDGYLHHPNIPSEETASAPDPYRVDGVVSATKPLDLSGALIEDLVVHFEGGRAVSIEGKGAGALQTRTQKDEGGSRLGEVALVDNEGRIGKTGTVFFNTLLDENAASHLAFGNAYARSVYEEDLDKINTSAIHIDFMIGGDDVAVTGITKDGTRVPVLRGGSWQV